MGAAGAGAQEAGAGEGEGRGVFCASFLAQTKKERGATSGLTHKAAWGAV